MQLLLLLLVVLAAYVAGTFVIFAGVKKVVGHKWPVAAQHNFSIGVMLTFSAAWPLLLELGSQSLYVASCNFGNAGAHVYENFRVDALIYRSRAHIQQWTQNSSFIERCSADCLKQLRGSDSVFYESRPWFSALNGGVAVEMAWQIDHSKMNTQRYTRMWITEAESKECLAVLRDPSKCIAGKEIEKISAKFELQDTPFLTPTGYESVPSTMEWRWFGVEKHQQRLLKDGKLVANYVWYALALVSQHHV